MDNWRYIRECEGLLTPSINSIHCDTRDFCCLFLEEKVRSDAKAANLYRLKTVSDKFLIPESEVISWLQSMEDITGGKKGWRCPVFKDVKCDGWLKYIRLYRYGSHFIVCNRDSEAIEWRNCTEDNLEKRYLGAH